MAGIPLHLIANEHLAGIFKCCFCEKLACEPVECIACVYICCKSCSEE